MLLAAGGERVHRLAFHVKRANATAGVGNVQHLLTGRKNFLVQRGHIHTLCESLHAVK